ncbi:MAG: serine/threonine-protein kinase [Gammaproteobacteria bacterium]
MRALIVHPSLDVRLLLSQCLAIHWPEIEVIDIDDEEWRATVELQGTRKADVVIVGADSVDEMFTLLDTVVVHAGRTPVVCIGPYGAADQALAVIEHGAASYRSMDDVSRASVREIVDAALADKTFDVSEDCTERLVFQSEQEPLENEVDADFVMNGKPVRIRGYTLNAKIGEGGMSRVFSAVRDVDGQEVVLKVMDGTMMQDPTQLQRFMHEYRIVAQIDSPSVVKIYDQGFTDDHVFIAMERFPGGDLKQRFGKAFPPKEALSMLWQISSALHAIHKLGIVHRDLKPQNIMFRADGSMALLDFGVSTMESMSTALTQSGELVGTPLYMSPEQAQGRPADARSDLYSLGTMFYEMITGKRVFTARSLMMIIHMHATEPPPRLPLPLQSMQELTDKLLAKDPADRFQSARELMRYVKQRWASKSSSDSNEQDVTKKLDTEGAIPAAGGWS